MPMKIERACAELGLEIIAPFDLEIDENLTIHFAALLPQLGGEKGMLVAAKYDEEKFQRIGPEYGYSCFDVHNETGRYNVESFKETFSDWGWNSTETEKPDWMR